MRIAVYHSLPPGGALRLVSSTVALLGQRHHVDVYTTDAAFIGGDEVGLTVSMTGAARVYRYALPLPILEPLSGPDCVFHVPAVIGRLQLAERAIAMEIDAGSYDLCWVHHSLLVQAPFLLRYLRTPSLYYVHEPRRASFETAVNHSPHRRTSSALAGPARMMEAVMRRADRVSTGAATAVAANSWFTAEGVFRAYGRSSWVCHPGVDHTLFRPSPDANSTDDAPAYVLAVGALHWIKGHELALEGIARMAAPRPALVIVYEREVPGYRAVLRRRAAELGVHLCLRRGIGDVELVDLYARALATLCISRLEPFGLTALESLSTGTPVVALREGGFRETVDDGLAGYLVEPTPESVAKGLETVRSGGLPLNSDAIRATVVPRFTWEATAIRLEELFARTLRVARSR
jgi:glycosyltransferase involved in cell wall biosynthesis